MMSPKQNALPQPEPLAIDDFSTFYEAVHGHSPFQWQRRLAELACRGEWPRYIKLPTASGKTAAIDIAIFSLAYQATMENRPEGKITAPRRIFFVVDRRIIVSDAYRRAKDISKKLQKSSEPILKHVAESLRYLAGVTDPNIPPLDCFELRGGIYRDDAWVRSPLQPTVLASTVDQVGSRLLFRGYGVTDRNLSIHAALTANDSLIILDEAHCSKPFRQTMESIERFRGEQWAQESIETPFAFVQMTATPPSDIEVASSFELTDQDYQADAPLKRRHHSSKPVELSLVAGAKGKKLYSVLAKEMVEQAKRLAEQHSLKKIALVANRVQLAREVFQLLSAKHPGRVSLMIGRMRPIDRDRLTVSIQTDFGAGTASAEADAAPKFVVATQCLEVGADLDFDGMVTQCASLDALRQRVGRLDRLGDGENRRGVILAAEGDIQPLEKLDDTKPVDPIYGNALVRTWHWLLGQSEANEGELPQIDFGVVALERLLAGATVSGDTLLAPAENAPVLMPAHVDMLCQTAPRPSPEPDVAAYLHGPNRGTPEVRVCWRADLKVPALGDSKKPWLEALELCPPTTGECLSVPLPIVRKWLQGGTVIDNSGDVLGEVTDDSDEKEVKKPATRKALVWRGKRGKEAEAEENASFCATAQSIDRIQPNDTLVIPVEYGGWNALGHIPEAPPEPTIPADQVYHQALRELNKPADSSKSDQPSFLELAKIDIADQSFCQSRARTILRVHPKLHVEDDLSNLCKELLRVEQGSEADLSVAFWRKWVNENSPTDDQNSRLYRLVESERGAITRYPGGVVWITEKQLGFYSDRLPLSSFGDDEDTLSQSKSIFLIQHLIDVADETIRFTDQLALPESLSETLLHSAKVHDLGKVDPRFQAKLLNKPLSVAYMQREPLAKSDGVRGSNPGNLPANFRHEMLSVDLTDCFEYDDSTIDSDLLRHLIASHHGHARPFAPVCIDDSSVGLNLSCLGAGIVSAEERKSWKPAHRLDSGIPERFWKMTRRHGWWGLAYLEALLRLADWEASANPGGGKAEWNLRCNDQRTKPSENSEENTLTLSGIDGSNPLGFLAAMGAFRVVSNALRTQRCDEEVRLSWKAHQGAWRPVFHFAGDQPTEDWLLDLLADHLASPPAEHPALRLSEELATKKASANTARAVYDQASRTANLEDRDDADWMSCNGSELANEDSISQLQTTRRDYHAINVTGLLNETRRDHLRRSLFDAWDYADPIAGVSLHLEPREDRRHAYQWHMPSGDPTRKTSGGMIGANRLALEAWPLFQSLPAGEKLTTIGFRGTRASDTQFSWPIWTSPISVSVLPSLLGHASIKSAAAPPNLLLPMGIQVVYRCSRILVGKTPNLTSPVAMLT
ncbi:MAG: type I-U CRISPR-associated helicase/endonuclease Cas3 [Pirellulaceae bacterium]